MDKAKDNNRSTFTTVLEDLREALARLDEMGAPAEVGAHLDLAIDRLEKFIDRRRAEH